MQTNTTRTLLKTLLFFGLLLGTNVAQAQLAPGLDGALPGSAFVEPEGVDALQRQILIADQILFDNNQSRVHNQQRFILDGLAQMMRDDPALQLKLLGHTDPKERDAPQLSLQRAQQVEALLLKAGISDERVEVVGHGASQPISYESAQADQNRRVEFKMFKEIRFREQIAFADQSATPSTTEPIEQVAERLQANPFVRLRIAGHADSAEGRDRSELDRLSLERAEQVRRALIARGVAPQRLSIVGSGDRSVASVSAPNRRVSFKIVYP